MQTVLVRSFLDDPIAPAESKGNAGQVPIEFEVMGRKAAKMGLGLHEMLMNFAGSGRSAWRLFFANVHRQPRSFPYLKRDLANVQRLRIPEEPGNFDRTK